MEPIQQVLKVADLLLDPENPRFYHLALQGRKDLSQDDLRKVIEEDGDTGTLAKAIRKVGVRDPIWVRSNGTGQYLVIEGNRRTVILQKLLEEGAVVRLHDPQAMPHMREVYAEEEDRLIYCSSPYEAAQDCDAVLLVTEWEEYRGMDLPRLRDLLRVPILIDGRNIYDPVRMRGLGFEYYSVGR